MHPSYTYTQLIKPCTSHSQKCIKIKTAEKLIIKFSANHHTPSCLLTCPPFYLPSCPFTWLLSCLPSCPLSYSPSHLLNCPPICSPSCPLSCPYTCSPSCPLTCPLQVQCELQSSFPQQSRPQQCPSIWWDSKTQGSSQEQLWNCLCKNLWQAAVCKGLSITHCLFVFLLTAVKHFVCLPTQ